jgi:hypothetical protein
LSPTGYLLSVDPQILHRIVNTPFLVSIVAVLPPIKEAKQVLHLPPLTPSQVKEETSCLRPISLHAGICLKDVVTASSAGLIDRKAIIDVNYAEESISSTPVLTIALLPKTKEVLSMESTGRLGFDSVSTVMDAATEGCLQVYEVMRQAVLSYVADSD